MGTVHRAAIYSRISVSNEASVSIDRQVESAEQYAAARGWQVVGVFKDDGVSASDNKPENRPGWRELLASPERFDAVIVWKLDRLARRALDFLHADEALQARKAGIVAVEDPVDMTTAQGRAFATMLAVFGEMEAEAIRARVRAARRYLVHERRVVGGTVPYGWRSVPNPEGPGFVLAVDPERIGYVVGAADRVRRGDTVYSVMQWLNEVGAPRPQARGGRWSYTTVERLLRHPVLAGMVPYNPGNDSKVRGGDVLRGSNGLPVVDESIAIMSVADWRAMIRRLDDRDSAQALPRAMKGSTSPLLSGLVWCGGCDRRMHRGTAQGRAGYSCPGCFQTITNFEDYVVEEFLRMKGERVRWTVVEDVYEGGAALLPEIEHRLAEVGTALQVTDDDAEAERLTEEMARLRALRREARASAPTVEQRWEPTTWFSDAWADAGTVEEKRAVLGDAIERIRVVRGRVGRGLDRSRLVFEWKQPEDVGPIPHP